MYVLIYETIGNENIHAITAIFTCEAFMNYGIGLPVITSLWWMQIESKHDIHKDLDPPQHMTNMPDKQLFNYKSRRLPPQ